MSTVLNWFLIVAYRLWSPWQRLA